MQCCGRQFKNKKNPLFIVPLCSSCLRVRRSVVLRCCYLPESKRKSVNCRITDVAYKKKTRDLERPRAFCGTVWKGLLALLHRLHVVERLEDAARGLERNVEILDVFHLTAQR